MNILIVDDDKKIVEFIYASMINAGHIAATAHDGDAAFRLAITEKYDLYIVDWMMPVLDGISLIKSLRARGDITPAIILTAKSHLEDKLIGLQSGCDDYVTKPFAIEELLARAELLYKRMQKANQSIDATTIHFGRLVLNKISHEVRYLDKIIHLQAREYKILLFLLENKNQVITRSMLLEHVWEYQFDPQTNVTDVHISRLRNKLAEAGLVDIIQTIRGVGYSLKSEEDRAI